MGDVHWRELAREVVDSGLCTGCAVCVMVCPRVVKIATNGGFQVWTRDGSYVELPLKFFHEHTRPGCKLCPDFAAQHADISCGGIGAEGDWTLAVVRTKRGEEWMRGVIDAGLVEVRPGESDRVAMDLVEKLSQVSRRRWPTDALPEERRAPGALSILS